MKIVNVWVCEGLASLDEDYLDGLAGGKFKAKEQVITLTNDEHQELKENNARGFDMGYYDSLLEDDKEDEAWEYFNTNRRCISLS